MWTCDPPTKHGFCSYWSRKRGNPVDDRERAVPKSEWPGSRLADAAISITKASLSPPFARQSLTEKDVSRHAEAKQAEWSEKIRNARNEGLSRRQQKGTVTIPGVAAERDGERAAVDPPEAHGNRLEDAPSIVTITLRANSEAIKREKHVPHRAAVDSVDGAFTHYRRDKQFVSASRLPSLSPPWFKLNRVDLTGETIKWQIPYGTVPSLRPRGHAAERALA